MLDYSIVAGQRVWQQIKRISLVFNIVTQILSMLVIAYITFTGGGFLPLNIGLLVLSAAYFVFYCVTVNEKKQKALRQKVKTFFKWSKRAIKLVNLGVMLYALVSNDSPTALDIVLLCFSLGCWVLDILFEIASIIVKGWGELMLEAVKADVETITAPFNATKNFLRGLTGKDDDPPPPPPTKRRILLDRLVAERKAELARKRQEQRLELSQMKEAARTAAADLKKAIKEEKKAAKAAKKNKGKPQTDEFFDEAAPAKDE